MIKKVAIEIKEGLILKNFEKEAYFLFAFYTVGIILGYLINSDKWIEIYIEEASLAEIGMYTLKNLASTMASVLLPWLFATYIPKAHSSNQIKAYLSAMSIVSIYMGIVLFIIKADWGI